MSSTKQYPVIDAQSAIKDHNKKFAGFQNIQGRIRPAADKLNPAQDQEPTLDDLMRQNGVPINYTSKLFVAKKLGMANYTGKPNEDKAILSALTNATQQSGDNQKVQQDTQSKDKASEQDSKNKDREFSLKQRELDIKEKEAENKKGPDADAIAGSLMKHFNNN